MQKIIELFNQLQPEKWSTHIDLTPLQRAKCFFLPDVDDLDIVNAAKNACPDYISYQENLATARVKFIKTINSVKYSKQFNSAACFYSSLFSGARQLQSSNDPDIIIRWPNIQFDGGTCCKICKRLSGKRFPKYSEYIKSFYPPWHFDCELYATDSDWRSSGQLKDMNMNQRFCNPFDLLIALGIDDGIKPAKQKAKKSYKPVVKKSVGCLWLIGLFGIFIVTIAAVKIYSSS